MEIPRVIEATLAEDWTSPWTGNTFTKGEAKIVIQSELNDSIHGRCLVSVPNPVPAYLAIVTDSVEVAKSVKSKMFEENVVFGQPDGKIKYRSVDSSAFDEYFQLTIVVVIFAFIALETWCNQVIPESYEYHRVNKAQDNKKEVLSKSEIERHVSIEEKLAIILPDIFSKPNFKERALWSRLKKFVKVRNEFTHLKSPERLGNNKTNYDPFFQQILDLDLDNIGKLPKDIMSHFIPDDLGF